MKKTLRKLLTRTFDYAGLFPPAKLNLTDAFQNYMEYWRSPDNWLLRRFLCLASHLDQLERIGLEYPDIDQYLDVSVVARAGKNAAELLELLDADLDGIRRFGSNPAATPKPTIDLKLPPDFDESLLIRILDKVSKASKDIGPIVAYFEAKATPDLLERVVKPLAKWRSFDDYYLYVGGYKLRCGGEEATLVPSAEQVAHAIACCRDHAGLDLKLTAGLHHPLRRFDPGLQTHTHGFINILMAGLLAKSERHITEAQMVEIVRDEDAASFSFADDACGWRDQRVSLAEMADLAPLIVAIGSCSFDEPRDDLKALGWW